MYDCANRVRVLARLFATGAYGCIMDYSSGGYIHVYDCANRVRVLARLFDATMYVVPVHTVVLWITAAVAIYMYMIVPIECASWLVYLMLPVHTVALFAAADLPCSLTCYVDVSVEGYQRTEYRFGPREAVAATPAHTAVVHKRG